MSERVDALARRATGDPFFLGSALREYARSEGLDEAGLAAVLACPIDALVPLALCRKPQPDPPQFRADVDRIAGRFEVAADALAMIVRRANALLALRQTARDEGMLMAARDREGDMPGTATEEESDA